MNVVDILVTIIVVTILVTIVLAIVTYIAYKLRLARRPAPTDEVDGPRYFEVHTPPAGGGAAPSGPADGGLDRIAAGGSAGADGRPRGAPAPATGAPPPKERKPDSVEVTAGSTTADPKPDDA